MIELTNPSNLPDPSEIDYMEEPVVSAEIMVTSDYVGAIMSLCQERRGIYISMEYIEKTRALIKYDLPLNEIIYDFFDALKSRSRGYASFDYELKGYERSELVKLDILINREQVDALSFIVFKDSAYDRGRRMCERLKEEIPRHLFEIPIQAAVGGKVIARETVKAMRKDVLAKCYGGDISRKRKLLEKQKEGEEADASGRKCRDPAGGIYERPKAGRGLSRVFGSVDKRMRKELELYIHIPFCMKKCQYCDFLSFQADEHTQHEYVEALLREIAYYGARCQDYTVTSIYIGGGTPSWLDEELTLRIMDAVRCSFLLAQDAEISIECNPGTVTDGKFAAYRRAGINRISIGLQSADKEELRLLGRIHL